MIQVEMNGKENFLVKCDDLVLLKYMQSVMDGEKVRCQGAITIPIKASVLLPEFKEYGIEMGSQTKAVIDKIMKNKELRVINIAKIKSQYGGEINFNYESKGRYKPLEHQKIMYSAMYFSDAAAVIADPGTCKTGPYLWLIDKRISQGKVKKALIITLTDLKRNVLEEMSAQIPHLKGVILSGKDKSDKILNKKFSKAKHNIDYDIYIANYESMRTLVHLIDNGYFDMVVLDEAHRVGFPGTEQTKAIVGKFENVPYKYIVTGTLHANDIMSFYMPFRYLGADTVPYANYYEFRRKYMTPVDPNQHIWKPCASAKAVVQKITGDLSVMFKKDDCLDLPPLIYEKYSCPMAPDQSKLYNELKDDLVSTIDSMCSKCDRKNNCDMSCEESVIAKSALVLSGKLQQIASGFYINTRVKIDPLTGSEKNDSNIITLDGNPKIPLMLNVLNNMPDGEKVIIWTNYTHACKLITNALSKAYGNKSFITCFGSEDAYSQVKLFESGTAQYVVANPRKMGVGQNMQFSHYQIFFSNSRSFVVRDQAEGRQHRQGQKSKVTIIDLVVEDSVDELALKCLKEKQDLNLTLSQLSRVLKKPCDIDIIIKNRLPYNLNKE